MHTRISRSIKRIERFLGSDVLDNGPQFIAGISVGVLISWWFSSKRHQHVARLDSGLPLVLVIVTVASASLWVLHAREQDKERDREAARTKERLDAADAVARDTNEKVTALVYSNVTGSGQVPGPLPYTSTEYVSPGIGIANVTAKASVEFGGMKIEAKGEVPEPEDDSGA